MIIPLHLRIAWRWVMLYNVGKGMPNLVPRFDPKGQHAIGYPHIDHEAGLSMHVYAFCHGEADTTYEITSTLFATGGRMLTFRSDILLLANIEILQPSQIAKFALPDVPPIINFYEMPELEPMRMLELLHPFRAPGYPDDIMFLLAKEGRENERIWGRIERDLGENRFEVTLLNEPYADFGIHKDDRLQVALVPFEGHPQISHIPTAIL